MNDYEDMKEEHVYGDYLHDLRLEAEETERAEEESQAQHE